MGPAWREAVVPVERTETEDPLNAARDILDYRSANEHLANDGESLQESVEETPDQISEMAEPEVLEFACEVSKPGEPMGEAGGEAALAGQVAKTANAECQTNHTKEERGPYFHPTRGATGTQPPHPPHTPPPPPALLH